jgi:hypothetical protein
MRQTLMCCKELGLLFYSSKNLLIIPPDVVPEALLHSQVHLYDNTGIQSLSEMQAASGTDLSCHVYLETQLVALV